MPLLLIQAFDKHGKFVGKLKVIFDRFATGNPQAFNHRIKRQALEDLVKRIHRDAEVAKTCLALEEFAKHADDPFLVEGLVPN